LKKDVELKPMASLGDAPDLRRERTVRFEAPLSVPIDSRHLSNNQASLSAWAFGSDKEFTINWQLQGHRRRVTTLRDKDIKATYTDDLLGTDGSGEMIRTADGCMVSIFGDLYGESNDILFAKKSCPTDVEGKTQAPSTIASVQNNGSIVYTKLMAGKDFHAVLWTHQSLEGKRTRYLSRIRRTDGTSMDPGGAALPFDAENSAWVIGNDKIFLAWIDAEKSKKKKNIIEEVVRVAFASDNKGMLVVGPPQEISRTEVEPSTDVVFAGRVYLPGKGRIAVSADDRAFLLVWESKGRLLSNRFSIKQEVRMESAPVLLNDPHETNRPQYLQATYLESKKTHFLFWNEGNRDRFEADAPSPAVPVKTLRVMTHGKKIEMRKQVSLGMHIQPRVIVSDTSILVIDHPDPTVSKPAELPGIRYDHDGRVLDKTPVPLALMSNAKRDVAAAFGDGMFLVVFRDNRNYPASGEDIFGIRIRASDGVALDDKAFPIAAAPNAQSAPKVSFSNGTFFVVWQDERNATLGMDIYGARVEAKDGRVLDNEGIAIAKDLGRQKEPAVKCALGKCMISWKSDVKVDGQLSTAVQEIALKDASSQYSKNISIPSTYPLTDAVRFAESDRRVFFPSDVSGTTWQEATIDTKTSTLKTLMKKTIRFYPEEQWADPKSVLLPKGAVFNVGLFSEHNVIFGNYEVTPMQMQFYTPLPWNVESTSSPYHQWERYTMVASDDRSIVFTMVRGPGVRLFVFDAKTAKLKGKYELRTRRPVTGASLQPAVALDDKGRVLVVFPQVFTEDAAAIDSLEATLLSPASK
jgi:hypothetical protein